MLSYALLFLMLAGLAALLGLTDIALISADFAKILIIVFLGLTGLSMFLGRKYPPVAR